MILLLYFDDLFLTKKMELIKVARRRLVVEFEIKDLGMVLCRHRGVVEWSKTCSPGLKECTEVL